MTGEEKTDYEVGYKKPPKETRFKPGQSGNSRGRPTQKAAESLDITKILEEPVFAPKMENESPSPPLRRAFANWRIRQSRTSKLALCSRFSKSARRRASLANRHSIAVSSSHHPASPPKIGLTAKTTRTRKRNQSNEVFDQWRRWLL